MKKRFGDSRDSDTVRPTMPPRTRPGKAYPGGKHLRRALANLARRREGRSSTKPGSMKS